MSPRLLLWWAVGAIVIVIGALDLIASNFIRRAVNDWAYTTRAFQTGNPFTVALQPENEGPGSATVNMSLLENAVVSELLF
jgi:hypothetical protein